MTAIAEKLDEVMRRLPPAAATSVEKLVRDVIEVVESAPSAETEREARDARIKAHREHISRCLEEASSLDWSDFERPPQGESEVREQW